MLLKYTGIYVLLLILIVFICSLMNLLGINSTITNLILFIFNMALFLIFGIKCGINATTKGFIAGLKVGLLFLCVLILINIITLKTFFNTSTIIYYLILILTSVMGGMLGINKKKDSK